MVILETKEQLVQQLSEAWQIISQADAMLEHAIDSLKAAHTDLRRFSRQRNDERGVSTGTRVESTPESHTGTTTKAQGMRRLSVVRREQMVGPRRDTPTSVSADTDAESGC